MERTLDQTQTFRGIARLWLVLVAFLGLVVAQSTVLSPQLRAQNLAASADDLLEYADLLFSRSEFVLAAQQYQAFIGEYKNHPKVQSAWFRLGECYLKADQNADAETTFNYLVSNYKTGAFVGAAAYRLGVLRFQRQDFPNASKFFRIAANQLTEPAAKLQSRFYQARSLQQEKKDPEALKAYEEIIADPAKDNPYQERAMLESARLYFNTGETEKATERFEQIVESASTPEIKNEALVRAGLLAADAGDTELSEKYLDQALSLPDDSPWKPLALVGALFNSYARGEYAKVLSIYNSGSFSAPDDSRAKVLLIVGHSFRLVDDAESAVRIYSLLENKFPRQPEGIEAGYRKLQVLQKEGRGSFPALAERFAEKQRQLDPEGSYSDMAYLMKAEYHFSQAEGAASGEQSEYAIKNYRDAATAYENVRVGKVDEKYHALRLFKKGWAEIASDNLVAGIKSLGEFLKKFPDSPMRSSALAKRAVAHQTNGNHNYALEDFVDIADSHPDAPEAEFALQQIALIRLHLKQMPEMIAAYQELIDRFPETKALAEAHYWMGVGHFDQAEYAPAVPHLVQAREVDPAAFFDKSTFRLIWCQYQLEAVADLSVEAKRYLEAAKTSSQENRSEIPPQILEYLGSKLASQKKPSEAEYFLTAASDEENPDQTSAKIWNLLANMRLELDKHFEAIQAFDHYLVQTERPSERATAYLRRGKAQLCIRDIDGARTSAQESLRSQKEGRTNAEARVLLGDVEAASGNLVEAAREYLVVSQIFLDPEVTPKALAKAINAYQALGNQEQVDKLSRELQSQFPDYVIPEELDDNC
ncbi:MAG: tetratricopeptide repeat protein [Verrucomicrobiota bacterium]